MYKEYIELRRQGESALAAFNAAKHPATEATQHFKWEASEDGDRMFTSWALDGFQLKATIRISRDTTAGISRYGRFQHVRQPGALFCTATQGWVINGESFSYFVPKIPISVRAESYSKRGIGRGEANRLARQAAWADLERALRYRRDWFLAYITVRAERCGITLGRERSLYFETDRQDGRDCDLLAAGLAEDALRAAKANLRALIATQILETSGRATEHSPQEVEHTAAAPEQSGHAT